ncbi:unnamed protein product [Linum tenue]|uniref:ATPase AAA-type core domain-containing protein n=1 Tax=Linum tenue TaxID=586396 RepID=A0AAV0R696_9ROSI|nr:unnamed protein product [Linum tenue]
MWNAELERDKLLHLEQRLKNHVFGQDEAVRAVTKAVRRSRTGVRNPTRPLASFLFAGPPAVGKTTLANALAIEFYESKDHLILFEMSDYDYKDFVSQLTESIIRNPRSVKAFTTLQSRIDGSGSVQKFTLAAFINSFAHRQKSSPRNATN